MKYAYDNTNKSKRRKKYHFPISFMIFRSSFYDYCFMWVCNIFFHRDTKQSTNWLTMLSSRTWSYIWHVKRIKVIVIRFLGHDELYVYQALVPFIIIDIFLWLWKIAFFSFFFQVEVGRRRSDNITRTWYRTFWSIFVVLYSILNIWRKISFFYKNF